jgi:hypothetical protein
MLYIGKLLDKRHHRKTIGLFLLAAEKSENSKESSLTAIYYIRNFPIVQQ